MQRQSKWSIHYCFYTNNQNWIAKKSYLNVKSFKNENDQNTYEAKQNGNEKSKDSDKPFDENFKNSPSSIVRREIKAEPTNNETKPAGYGVTGAQNGMTCEDASVKQEAVNSLVDPVLSSTVEDINKYYKPELLYRLNGIDLNEVTSAFWFKIH